MREAVFLLLVSTGGCTAPAAEVEPPLDQLFFPTAAAISPDEQFLFVASANSQLEYDGGVIDVVDLARADSVIADWTSNGAIPDGCYQDTDHLETLVCDETAFFVAGAGVETGNFATDLAVQDRGNGRARLILPVRGDPSVTWIDWDNGALDCGTIDGTKTCDDAHRLTNLHGDATLTGEPFEAYADSVNDFAVVTFLDSGVVALVDSPRDGTPALADALVGLFAVDTTTGLLGSSGVTGHAGIVYAGSEYEDRIQMLSVGRPLNSAAATPYLLTGNWFFLDAVGGNVGASADTRSLKYSLAHDQFYDLNRDPPTLQVVSTAATETGFATNAVVGTTDICRTSEQMAVTSTEDDERVYMTCFADGKIDVVDPRGQATLEDSFEVGRGPYGIVASPLRQRVYVTNFLEDTIAVIDTQTSSGNHDRVVLRIGVPKPL